MKYIENPNVAKMCKHKIENGEEFITRDDFSGKYKKLLRVAYQYAIPVGLQCETKEGAEAQ